jgi:hypothetical protein
LETQWLFLCGGSQYQNVGCLFGPLDYQGLAGFYRDGLVAGKNLGGDLEN